MTETPISTEIEKRSHFETADLRSISSLEDAVRLLTDNGLTIADATTAIGDGFEMLEDKDLLIKVPFIALTWSFTQGDFGADYLIMRIVTADGKKFVVTDGSTGLCRQVQEFERETGRTAGLKVERGLRKSEYFLGADNQPVSSDEGFGKGYTYYLNV